MIDCFTTILKIYVTVTNGNSLNYEKYKIIVESAWFIPLQAHHKHITRLEPWEYRELAENPQLIFLVTPINNMEIATITGTISIEE